MSGQDERAAASGKAAPDRDAPICLPGGDEGVLMIHGFCSSPGIFRYLAEILNGRGMTVSAPLLTGHGTEPEAICDIWANEWINDAERAYADLAARCRFVHLVGISMGGALAAYLAGRHTGEESLKSASLLVPGYALRNHQFYEMDFEGLKYKRLYVIKQRDYPDERQDLKAGYDCMCVGAIKKLIDLFPLVADWERLITAPTQVLYSAADPVCDPEVIGERARNIRPLESIHCYPESEHNLFMGEDHEDVNRRILEFIESHRENG